MDNMEEDMGFGFQETLEQYIKETLNRANNTMETIDYYNYSACALEALKLYALATGRIRG